MKQNMRNTIKYAVIIGLALGMVVITLTGLQAQVDENRMQKDLDIMKRFMIEWFKSSNPDRGNLYVKTHTASARYTPDFGILLRTPQFSTSRSSFNNRDFFYYYDQNTGQVSVAPDADDQKDTKNMQALEDSIVRLMQGFLAAYGDIASQLPEDEKVMLVYGQPGSSRNIAFARGGSRVNVGGVAIAGTDDGDKKHGNMSVSIDKQSLDDFRAERISENELYDRMSIIRAAYEEDVPMEFKVFGGVLKDIVKVDNFSKQLREHLDEEGEDELDDIEDDVDEVEIKLLSEVLTLEGSAYTRLNFEYLEGFGVVYQLKTGHPFARPFVVGSGRNRIKIDSDHISGRFDGDWVDVYTELVTEELQRALIDYGRTLRKLKQGEWLVVLLDLPGCKECEAPSQIELKVPQNVLVQYDSRKINLDTAIDRIDIRAIGKASEKKEDFPMLIYDEWKNDDE